MFHINFFQFSLFVALIGFCMARTSMLTYQTPGTYLLKPENYSYSDTVIFELWGAGAGGGDPEPKPCIRCGGGGGGSYLKAFIKTNNQTFNITVGSGGYGGRGDFKFFGNNSKHYQGIGGSNGESTIVINLDGNHVVNLVAGGGFSGDIGGIGGYVLSMEGSENYIAIQGSSHQYLGHPTLESLFIGGNGAMGGSGGNTYFNTKLHDMYYLVVGHSGGFPGGGGFGMSSTTFTNTHNSTTTCGSGGNGAVIVYYEKNTQPTLIVKNDDASESNHITNFTIVSTVFLVVFILLTVVSCVILIYKYTKKHKNITQL
ncbi:putative orfan [Tupanvirus soda lake]|uniref:Orfan n=2 Tax=Tupanvirus TaxID=2094720 RepID=A0AC62AB43_9VIRU|nr:putative orfan [Tupanvirus soda lake]QKU35001.1 putative orfan [Tupanvirus soda lake]